MLSVQSNLPKALAVAVLLSAGTVVHAESSGEATLPLSEVLQLYRDKERARQPGPSRPPIAASLQNVEARARLLDTGVELALTFTVRVLDGEVWSRVPLLSLDNDTHITSLPALDGGVVARDGDTLAFFSNHADTYELEVQLFKEARASGNTRQVAIAASPAAASTLHARYDQGVFRLSSAGALPESDGAVLYARNGLFDIRWELHTPARMQPLPRRAPIDPVIAVAHASVVSTLEGERTIRILYELRLAGEQRLSFSLPEGTKVIKALVNQRAVAVEAQGGTFELIVGPARAGDESGRVELMLDQAQSGYLLSGLLDYEFPQPSWRTNELWVTLHLPDVFNYQWLGGTLAPADEGPAAAFTHEMPTPGKVVVAKQLLVASMPHLRLTYAVDLEGHYFH